MLSYTGEIRRSRLVQLSPHTTGVISPSQAKVASGLASTSPGKTARKQVTFTLLLCSIEWRSEQSLMPVVLLFTQSWPQIEALIQNLRTGTMPSRVSFDSH